MNFLNEMDISMHQIKFDQKYKSRLFTQYSVLKCEGSEDHQVYIAKLFTLMPAMFRNVIYPDEFGYSSPWHISGMYHGRTFDLSDNGYGSILLAYNEEFHLYEFERDLELFLASVYPCPFAYILSSESRQKSIIICYPSIDTLLIRLEKAQSEQDNLLKQDLHTWLSTLQRYT